MSVLFIVDNLSWCLTTASARPGPLHSEHKLTNYDMMSLWSFESP